MASATLNFPTDFLWGTATSSFQVEGHNFNSDWHLWESEGGRIRDNDRSGPACRWWTDAEQDIDLAAEMGTNAHRFSVEWSRIEPQPGQFDPTALERYRTIAGAMVDRGIEPMVTLHHFSNPIWLSRKGDFLNEETVGHFRRFATETVGALGDLVPKWITINEPMVYVSLRYLMNAFPAPSSTGLRAALAATRNLLRCHASAFEQIKAFNPDLQVGVAKQYRPIQARRRHNPLDRTWSNLLSRLFNDSWMEAMETGHARRPLKREEIPGLKGSFDFIGLNYYTRSFAGFPTIGRPLLEEGVRPDSQMSDDDFIENYPAGLFEAIKANLKYGKPIYITENGLPDRADKLRPAYLLLHLREIWRAVSFNYPVMGYYHWTLVDNFEWERGWSQRFGLYSLETESQTRIPRNSAILYSQICASSSLSDQMARDFAPETVPILFPGRDSASPPQGPML